MDIDLGSLVKISIEHTKLVEKMIEEKIRSDKVIEGILKDIYCGVDRIGDVLGDINIREELKYTFQERDIMDENGIELAGQGVDEAAEDKKVVIDQLNELVILMGESTDALQGLVKHAGLIVESIKEMIGDTKMINQNMQQSSIGLKTLVAEVTKAEEPEPEAEQNEQGEVETEEPAAPLQTGQSEKPKQDTAY